MTGAFHLGVLAERAAERRDADHRSLLFEGRWWTSGELHDRVTRIAGGLSAIGLRPGDRVVVVMATTPDVGVLYQACWRAGLVATPVLFLVPPAELRTILIDSAARCVITTPEFLDNVRGAADGLDVTIVLDGDAAGTTPLADLAAAAPVPIVDRRDDDLAALLYTGGTTGRAKGVELTHTNLWYAGRAGYESTADDRLGRTLMPLPLAHSFGLLVSVTSTHDPEPGVAVLQRWFDPEGFCELVAEHHLQQATVVPTMLRVLLTLPLESYDLSSLERIVCGSAPLPPAVLHAFEQRVPSVTICEGYGLTETAAAATVNRRTHRKVGTVGQPLPGTELRIVGAAGEPAATGDPGEVWVRSAANARGYRGETDGSDTFTSDGWVRTGDIGALDDEGFLTILDRMKDLVIRNGFNIYPRDVEEALVEHDAVAAAAVVGEPGPVTGSARRPTHATCG
ncbi:MAG: AMP-binding protein [Nitriliruptor sp.]|uniref:class I adenylate-forming enzyme family protein n=1 Tax=Nitriliruptor sp. TaxID=2448056 RepID=UPI0034A039EC